jgi:hypothetical protein
MVTTMREPTLSNWKKTKTMKEDRGLFLLSISKLRLLSSP